MPTSASDTPGALVPERSSWARIGAMLGCFLGAIAIGSGVGHVLQPDGQATTAVVMFALLLVFVGGMALWGTIGASIMAKTIFDGDLAHAVLRFLLHRRREDIPRIELDRTKILAAAHRVLGWTRLFVWVAVGIGIPAAVLAGWFARTPFAPAALLTLVVIVAYGAVLRRLARTGYLIPPDME